MTNGSYGQLQFPGRDYAGMPYSQRVSIAFVSHSLSSIVQELSLVIL